MVTAMADSHVATDAQVSWYGRRAGTGLGLVVVESTGIAPDGLIVERQLALWDDAFVPGMARIARAIHEAGVPAVVQLVHGGARAWRPDLDVPRVGPSSVRVLPGPEPVPLDEAGIATVIRQFAEAARRAVAASFDGIEVHAAHYYLLSQFLSPYTNRREDRWGGELSGRARLLLEVVAAVRQAIGHDKLLLVRTHCLEAVEGGLSTEEAVAVARLLEMAGVDVIDASGVGEYKVHQTERGSYLATSSAPPKGAPAGFYLPHVALLKRAVSIPVIAVGKLGDHVLAQRVLDEGQADLVALGRQLIADPEAAAKLLAGRTDELVRCDECMTCFGSIRRGPVRCSVNLNP
jgi:2,4-dienoyl-CoA reductase-like NADH-dependent reductase (Old Yellow Enzyme family)